MGKTISLKSNSSSTAGTAEFVKITDGTLTASVRDTGGSDSLNVSIVDASGNQVTSFGSSTVSIIPTSSVANALSRFRSLTVNSTAQAIKASAGNLYGFNIINLHTSTIYVKIYNVAAGSVNPASDVPIKTLMVPANGAIYQEPNCIQTSASTALSVRAVTDSGDTGTTAPGTLPIIELEYL